ncbi:MAG TPA: hypothetical protein PLM06_07115 [Anaerolineae bacterium]|nr:hypothetical protein [Anaerolineae bacterium]
MLAPFDWLRLARSSSELLATLHYLDEHPDAIGGQELASPRSALQRPCDRCGLYPHERGERFCSTCKAILEQGQRLYSQIQHITLVWGYVTQLPQQLRGGTPFPEGMTLHTYVHDAQHFLTVLPRQQLKPWLQELALYNSLTLQGLLQVFPGSSPRSTPMNELLIRVIHHEARFPPDRLRVRFLAAPHYIYHLHELDREGVLTFEISDFISTLEMASVFRTLLLPDEQTTLRQLLKLRDDAEAQFYWGRFLGQIKPEVRDMLNAWQIRRWSPAQVDLLYRLSEYARYY